MSRMNIFKKITRKDLSLLEKHYLRFDPYSDFSAVSIWGYMVPGARYLQNEGAILYEMRDYNHGHTYLTILGGRSSRELVRDVAQQINQPTFTLYAVPESTCITAFQDWPAVISTEEDASSHDYIFSVEELAGLSGSAFKDKRKTLTKLKKKYPELQVKTVNHASLRIRIKMYAIFKNWIRESGSRSWRREYRALKRVLKLRGFDIICIGAFDKKRMVGFTVNEIESNHYYQGHFGKASYHYRGLGLLLEHETARIIQTHFHSKFINLQQDLGIEGIRYYKQSLRPLKQLKKYNVTISTKLARVAPT